MSSVQTTQLQMMQQTWRSKTTCPTSLQTVGAQLQDTIAAGVADEDQELNEASSDHSEDDPQPGKLALTALHKDALDDR